MPSGLWRPLAYAAPFLSLPLQSRGLLSRVSVLHVAFLWGHQSLGLGPTLI